MKDILIFKNDEHFKMWLEKNHHTHKGIWIRFDKNKDAATFSSDEALNVALCFGWIDSTIKRIDERYYIKYFAKRRQHSIWSKKNKDTVQRLIDEGRMTKHGLAAIEIAKKNGLWDKQERISDAENHLLFLELVKQEDVAYQNIVSMSKSVQKTYAQHYFSAKNESTKVKRFREIVERLIKNLGPM